MKIERTYDMFYLQEAYKQTPKEQYKFIENEMATDLRLKKKDAFSLLDIGCETGSFLYYMRNKYPNAELGGRCNTGAFGACE